MTHAERLTRLGVAIGCSPPRKLDPPPAYFRVDESKLQAEALAAAEDLEASMRRYQHRFSRIERTRSRERKAQSKRISA